MNQIYVSILQKRTIVYSALYPSTKLGLALLKLTPIASSHVHYCSTSYIVADPQNWTINQSRNLILKIHLLIGSNF